MKLGKKKSKEKLEAEITKAIETIKSVYSELPSYDIIIPALLKNGINELGSICKLTPGNLNISIIKIFLSY